VLDVLKGALPTAAMRLLTDEPIWSVAAGLAAILGHLFPLYLRLRGGKGVATGFGVVAVLLPIPASMAFLVWLMVLSWTRYVAVASIAAAIALAVFQMTRPDAFSSLQLPLTGFCILVALAIAIRHRSNVVRLLNRSETAISESSRLLSLAQMLHVLALALWVGGGAFFSFAAAPALFAFLDSAAAGNAVSAVFPFYFLWQGGCFITALGTVKARRPRFLVRVPVLLAAGAFCLASFEISGTVAELRAARLAADPGIAEPAKAAFGKWHAISLMLNFATLGFAGAGLMFAANLPSPRLTEEHDSL
jgi:acyl phosphate:glycerol-3-phosphate acyltransferase